MIVGFLQFLYFLVGPFASAYAGLFVYGKWDSLALALLAGTMMGALVLILISASFWADPNACNYCVEGAN